MRKYLKYSLAIIIVIFGITITFLHFKTNKDQDYIDKILETSEYSYLPVEAQNYIKEIYEETGEVILTEKNKEENTPYLNPSYVSYLELSDAEKSKVEVMPNEQIVDYVYGSSSITEEFPRTYDLRNVDGKSYVSPLKNQGSFGLCWAFAAIENAESYLMVTNDEEYNENTLKFSVRQLDYATSLNGIKNYALPSATKIYKRKLTDGGNFDVASDIMSVGLSLFNDTEMPYSYSTTKKGLYEIINYSKSQYEVNSTVKIPNISNESELKAYTECTNSQNYSECENEIKEEMFKEYLKVIKNGIKYYGGISVNAFAPNGYCGVENEDGYYVIDPNNNCYGLNTGDNVKEMHAMQVIGWDDDYEYTYCKPDYTGYSNQNVKLEGGECSTGSVETGTGAFLLQNSWGENNMSYVYLTYNSVINYEGISFDYIESMSKMSERNWDNVILGQSTSVISSNNKKNTFTKTIQNEEKIQKIKFTSSVFDAIFTISLKIGNETYILEENFQADYPGIHTVDVSNKNIILDEDVTSYSIVITSEQDESISGTYPFKVFTKNITDNFVIKSEDNLTINSNSFTIYSETENIPSNSEIIYELYKDNIKIDNVLYVEDNYVGANNVNAHIIINQALESGNYTLVQKYDDISFFTNLKINSNLYEGTGTYDNPYKIYTENDLIKMSNQLDAYYELENDIEITSDWNPIGTKTSPFTGVFNGKNHKIINLEISSATTYSGLFGYVQNSEDHLVYIKNVTLINPNIDSGQYVGALIGGINLLSDSTNSITIDSIYVVGGVIAGSYASSLIADISGLAQSNLFINNIFSSSTIKGTNSSNMIRFNYNNYIPSKTGDTVISNIENVGIMYDNAELSSYVSSLIDSKYFYYYNLSNYVSIGYSKKSDTLNRYYDTPITSCNDTSSRKGIVLKRSDSLYKFGSSIITTSDIVSMSDSTLYSSWENFNTYWEIKEIDEIGRIPTLKGINYEYSSISNNISEKIYIDPNDTISLLDYITAPLSSKRIKVTTENTDIIEIKETYDSSEPYASEIKLIPKKTGSGTIKIISDNDGYFKEISFDIYKVNPKITYHYGEITKTQNTISGTTVTLESNTFENNGYQFIGWNTMEDGTGENYNDAQEIGNLLDDLDLYAMWEKIVNITFDSNGGEGTIDKITSISGETIMIPANGFTKSGYAFDHWNTKNDGTGDSYNDNESITITNSIILYAIWEPIHYTVN